MKRFDTIAGRLALFVSLGFAAIWLLAVLATALVLKGEQEELLDLELRETASVLLPVLSRAYRGRAAEGFPARPEADTGDDPTETLIWILTDRSGATLMQSTEAAAIARPDGRPAEGFSETGTHVFYTTAPDPQGLSIRFGDPKAERFEAYRDSFLAFLVPMLAILPLGYLLVGWIARAALRPLDTLRAAIAARDHGRLDPIDAAGQPAELRAITATLNGFMTRLSRSLEGERAFATNAAHELRTPVAVALAQTQRLRAGMTGEAATRAARIEDALKRMGRLVARLLQLARADAGIGISETPADIARLLDLVIDDCSRDPDRAARLRLTRPDMPVLSPIDPDAFAIAAGNLIDNAFQHAPADTPIEIHLSRDGHLHVRNQGTAIPGDALAGLKQRFGRNGTKSGGFGLGLYITDTIARQTGGSLTVRSPIDGMTSGFEAELAFPGYVPASDP